MTEKRFEIDVLTNELWTITDNLTGEYANPVDGITNILKGLINTMNNFYEENERLIQENEQLKQQLKTKCIVNKQYEENQRLIKMLDNVANYMQKQHKDMPIDDFVEWWNNIATEGL